MKIVDARVIITCPGRNFVTLKIITHQGLYRPVNRLEDGALFNW